MTAWLVATATSARASGAAAIPFRQDAGGAGASIVGALAVTAVLLCVVVLIAAYARRRGWLDQWIGPAPHAHAPRLRLEQALRLSPRTSLYRVRHDGQVLLVVESTASARVVTLPGHGGDGRMDAQDAIADER